MTTSVIAPLEARKGLGGLWAKESDKKETYEMEFTTETAWGCTRKNDMGPRRFRLTYDKDKGRVWWGESYFLDPSEFAAKPKRAQWYRAGDTAKRRAAFVWVKVRDARPEELQVKSSGSSARVYRPAQSGAAAVPAAKAATPSKSTGPKALPAATQATPKAGASPLAAPGGSGGKAAAAAPQHITPPSHRASDRGKASPEVILDLEQALVLYKPPYWKCELPERDDALGKGAGGSPLPPPVGENALNLLCWIAEKGLGIDKALYAEDHNPALSGTGFGPLGHRIDQETSGPLLVAKTAPAQRQLKSQFHRTDVSKRYVCLVHGRMATASGVVDASIRTLRTGNTTRSEISSSGDWALTSYTVIATYAAPHLGPGPAPGGEQQGCSLVACDIMSGRTHQIRVHMQHLGHPLISDDKYLDSARALSEDRAWCPRLFLHCYRLKFQDPHGEEQLVVCPLPDDLKTALTSLGGSDSAGHSTDKLFDDTSWQCAIFRPPPTSWRPGTRVLRRVVELINAGGGVPISLSQLSSDDALTREMAEEGLASITKKWLARHWDVFEVMPSPAEATEPGHAGGLSDLRLKLRPFVSGDALVESGLERQVEAVRTELEDLQRQKMRAVAQEEYKQAAEYKRKAEVVSAELSSLLLLLEGEEEGVNDELQRSGEAVTRASGESLAAPKAAAFVADVRDEELFPALVPTATKSWLVRPGSVSRKSASTGPAQRASSRPPVSEVQDQDFRPPPRAEEVRPPPRAEDFGPPLRPEAPEEEEVPAMKDALKQFLLTREGYVATLNDLNKNKYLRQVMVAQQPKALTSINKKWVSEHDDTFTLLVVGDQTCVALESSARPKFLANTRVASATAAPDPQAFQRQIVQKVHHGAAQTLVYGYSTAVRTETARELAETSVVITSWQDKFLDVLRETPTLPRAVDDLLEAVPAFAETMGARRPTEKRQMLVTFLKACSDVFRVERSGFAAQKGGFLVWALKK